MDRQHFVETLAEVGAKTGWQVPRLRPPAESFSSGGRDASAESGRWNGIVSGHLHQRLQPGAQALRPSVLWPLQIADRRWLGQQPLSYESLISRFSCPIRFQRNFVRLGKSRPRPN